MNQRVRLSIQRSFYEKSDINFVNIKKLGRGGAQGAATVPSRWENVEGGTRFGFVASLFAEGGGSGHRRGRDERLIYQQPKPPRIGWLGPQREFGSERARSGPIPGWGTSANQDPLDLGWSTAQTVRLAKRRRKASRPPKPMATSATEAGSGTAALENAAVPVTLAPEVSNTSKIELTPSL